MMAEINFWIPEIKIWPGLGFGRLRFDPPEIKISEIKNILNLERTFLDKGILNLDEDEKGFLWPAPRLRILEIKKKLI